MGALPKKKHTRSRSNKRRNAATNKPMLPNLQKCPHCGALKKPHLVCPHCGKYGL